MFKRTHYDAIIVGAGATGGWAAKTLTEAGMHVLVLEAGRSRRWIQTQRLFERVRNKAGYLIENDHRAVSRQCIQAQCYAWRHDPHAFVDDAENPYTTPEEKPFAWIRARQVGGRVMVRGHGLHFYRFSDFDFKAASGDGFGVDWPIGYSDLDPFYDRVERFMGLVGNADNIAQLPNPIPGAHIEITSAERHLQTKLAERWPDRKLITRRTAPPPLPIATAHATGRLTLRTEALVREILVDADTGRARGVSGLERGQERYGYGVQVLTIGNQCHLNAFGEMLPRATNRVTIDPVRKDRWGIPSARINCEHSDNERAQAKDAMTECREMLTAAGFDLEPGDPKLGIPGLAIHECRTARMGSDAKTSALNAYNQSWDVKNLFVVDGACFVSQGAQNPMLTMMAIALRASERIVDLCRRYEL
jgi:choline dehydrogenase-like flavoprotein